MIVATTADGVRLVTQPVHAALAGQFADRWGGAVEPPDPRGPVVHAATAHDDGWRAEDRCPRVRDGEVVGFTDIPADRWAELYERGAARVAAADPYAGLLVSLHGVGLRRARFGRSPSWPAGGFEGYVAAERERQATLADEAGLSGADRDLLAALHEDWRPGPHTGAPLWRNYLRLQVWDELSLFLCTALAPERTTLAGVPAGPDESVTVTVERVGADDDPPAGAADGGTYRLDPYPFEAAPLAVSVAARTVPRATVAGGDPCRWFHATPRERVRYRLVA